MVISIRGTNGSGKSTVVRRVMASLIASPVYISGRRRPYGYQCARADGSIVYVPGHYETACGGCDTITRPVDAYAAIGEAVTRREDVLYEGIIVQDDAKRTTELNQRDRVVVLALRVPVEECLKAVADRRLARGDTRPLNPRNTVNRVRSIEGTVRRLQQSGVETRWVTRAEAEAACRELLNVPSADVEEEFHLS